MRLTFLSAGAARGLVEAIAREDAVDLAGHFGAVVAMREKLLSGEACDVVILTHAQMTELAGQGRVSVAQWADLGSVATAIAVRAGDPMPAVASSELLRAALCAAEALYVPDPGKATAGRHFAKVVEALGIQSAVLPRLNTYPNGEAAMRALAHSRAPNPIGCTQASEILATPGVAYVGALPPGLELQTVYTAAVSPQTASAQAARAFVDRLAGEAARATRAHAGFEGFVIRAARAQDLAVIRDIVYGVLSEFGLAPDPSGTDADLADIEASYFAPGGRFEVAVGADGRVAGCCGLLPRDSMTCELRKMYLRKDARGHGIGARLLRRALAFARNRGYRTIELETAAVLKGAIALYRGAGFRPIEPKHLARRCDQAYALEL